ncbi:MAG: hypothetical protein ACKOBG_06960 [Actinomycetota bacterium]
MSDPSTATGDTFSLRTILPYALTVFVLDSLAGWEIEYGTVFSATTHRLLDDLEVIGTVIFVLATLTVIGASVTRRPRLRSRAVVGYLLVATAQALAAVAALVATGHTRDDSYLWGLWDLVAAYLMVVAVFTGWYWACDHLVPGGAFVFPNREGEPPPEPRLLDYVFIAFNTNATFGPTTESVISRRVKALMMLQTAMSLALLLVLVARVVSIARG